MPIVRIVCHSKRKYCNAVRDGKNLDFPNVETVAMSNAQKNAHMLLKSCMTKARKRRNREKDCNTKLKKLDTVLNVRYDGVLGLILSIHQSTISHRKEEYVQVILSDNG